MFGKIFGVSQGAQVWNSNLPLLAVGYCGSPLHQGIMIPLVLWEDKSGRSVWSSWGMGGGGFWKEPSLCLAPGYNTSMPIPLQWLEQLTAIKMC